MNRKKIVVALGHRALGNTLPEQKTATKAAAAAIADLVEAGASLAITHSNAPQVGMIHAAMNEFSAAHPEYTAAPMSVCSAMSQGYIGYDLQNSIRSELIGRGIYRPVATVLTQVTVNPYDDAFAAPTKLVGRLLTQDEADAEEEKGNFVEKVEGGYRRIISSPMPEEIVELDTIRLLFDAGQIVIAAGGGGIPVLPQDTQLKGASAVIEKDLISQKLACDLHADELLILTSVESAYTDYKKPGQTAIAHITVAEAKALMQAGHFGEGSMLPKIQAAIGFLEKGGKRVVITSIEHALDGFLGKAGTIIE